MHYFKKHIGDYRSATAHLSLLEHGVYCWLIDTYYLNEQPLPLDERELMRLSLARAPEEKQAVLDILADFFTKTDAGWVHTRCDEEIVKYHSKGEKAKNSASARWNKSERNANASETHEENQGNEENVIRSECIPDANHKPITNNHKPITKDTPVNLSKESADDMPDVCVMLRGLGVSLDDQRKQLPDIIALVNRGATLEDFTAGLAVAADKHKGFAYSLGVVRGRLDDKANPAKARASPKMTREDYANVPDASLAEHRRKQRAGQTVPALDDGKTLEAT